MSGRAAAPDLHRPNHPTDSGHAKTPFLELVGQNPDSDRRGRSCWLRPCPHPLKPLEYVLLDIIDSGGEFLGGQPGTAGEQALADERRDGRGLPSATGPGAAGGAVEKEQAVGVHAHWSYRAAIPAVDRLLARGRAEDELGVLEATRSACDEWLSDGDLSIVVGEPRAGKSSLLRFVVSDLLGDGPRSALAAKFGSHLPVWLPFSSLCEYLKGHAERLVESAVRAWLTRYSAQHLHHLVVRAVADDRLLLVVDGLDERTDEGSARPALTLLESFVRSRNVAAIVSSRPYALRRRGSPGDPNGFRIPSRWS
jgi:hypothetical protein